VTGAAFPVQASAVERLIRRSDFRAVAAATAAAAGLRASGRAFVLQTRPRGDRGGVRVGFTVSRQVGNAVERNRVRRRLREVVRLAATGNLHDGHDYVLIGRRAALQVPFAEMMRELDTALRRVHGSERGAGQTTGGAGARPLHEAGARPARTPRNPGRKAGQKPGQKPGHKPGNE
jgi:ribonuclease P protein component